MGNEIKLLGIAPYEELNISMNTVGEQFGDIQINIFTADLVEGQQLAAKLFNDGYDAIISRGGTASLIRKSVSIPVIDVSISIYDILSVIRLAENYTKNFAIVGYSSITEKAHLLCDILGYNIEIHTINDDIEAIGILDALAKKNYEIILCDAITNRLAINKSLNTILITSGLESIKHAYDEAISIAKHLKKIKHEKDVLEQGINSQNQKYLIFDENFTIQFSNLNASVAQHILKYLRSKKEFNDENQFYSSINNKFYSLHTKYFSVDGLNYHSCSIKAHVTPNINNNLGILYKKKSEISDIFATKLLFTQFIPESTKIELQKINNYYPAVLIFGETGTAKKNIAYQAYLYKENNNNYLISVNCKLMNEKIWKFLVNSSNGPFVDTNNTILFEHIDQLFLSDIEHLISMIKNTNLLKKNNLIFSYDISKSNDKKKCNLLMTQLNCASIYAPSIRERKNELSIITTLLLNKVNIECSKEIMGFDPKAMEEFLAFDWPGNLNQLQSAIKELIINATTYYISEHQVSDLLNKERLIQGFSSANLKSFSSKNTVRQPTLFDYTKEIILNILDQNKGNQTKTAEQLGISRTTLWRYLKTESTEKP